jgi:hypothetical protein
MTLDDGRTDSAPTMPRWLALVLATAATLLAIGALWSLAPGDACALAEIAQDDQILPGPQPCGDGSGPALVTAGILLALLASVFVAAFTVRRRRGTVVLVIAGVMLLVLIIGAIATVAAGASGPVIYY